MKQAALDYRQEYFDHGEMAIHGDSGFDEAATYEDWLDKLVEDLTRDDGYFVPATTYFGVVNGEIVGTLQIRHKLNDALRKGGGHIGFGIRPSRRRKGYATKMLTIALEKCREMGIDEVLIICYKTNTGSAKTIINNGGVLDSEYVDDCGNVGQRYWVSTGP